MKRQQKKNATYERLNLVLEMYEDKQILRNVVIVSGNMWSSMLLYLIWALELVASCVFYYLEGRLYLLDYVYFAVEMALLLTVIYLSWWFLRKVSRREDDTPLDLLNPRSLIEELFSIQVLVNAALHLSVLHGWLVLFLYLEMTQERMALLAMTGSLYAQSALAAGMRLLYFWALGLLVLMHVLLFKEAHVFYNDVLLLLFVVGTLLYTTIQTSIFSKIHQERAERIEKSYETMHDLRNYIYTLLDMIEDEYMKLNFLIENTENNSKQRVSIQSICTDDNIYTDQISNFNKRLSFYQNKSEDHNISKKNFNLLPNIEEDYIESNDICENYDNENISVKRLSLMKMDSKIKKDKYYEIETVNSEKLKIYNDEKNENKINQGIGSIKTYYDENEFKKQKQFILFKVCFLYHLELIFENNYIQKVKSVDVREMVEATVQTMKVLFMNKNNAIRLQLRSYERDVPVDPTIFEYLLVDLCKLFHDLKYDRFKLYLYFHVNAGNVYIRLNIKVIELSENTIRALENKNIFKKLLLSLSHNVSYKFSYDDDKVLINIIYPISTDYENYDLNKIHDSKSKYHYNLKIDVKKTINTRLRSSTIKSMRVDNPDEERVNPYEKYINSKDPVKPYTVHDGVVYINVDDEQNILKMNARVFKKEGVELACCSGSSEFLYLLAGIRRHALEKQTKAPRCYCVMDHMLDNEMGYEIVEAAREFNIALGLQLTFVLLSSTEDKDTRDKYTVSGATDFIVKPLNKGKLKLALENFRSTYVNKDSEVTRNIKENDEKNKTDNTNTNEIAIEKLDKCKEKKSNRIKTKNIDNTKELQIANPDANNNVNKSDNNDAESGITLISIQDVKIELNEKENTKRISNNEKLIFD